MNSSKMQAIICTKYGNSEVLQMQETKIPVPKNNELLIKIRVTTVTAADCMIRKGSPYIGRLFMGFTKPKYPVTGTGFSGEVVRVGKDVTFFKKGDEVFGESLFGSGTNAEYLCVAEDGIIAKKPTDISHEELASVCDGPLTSLNLLRDRAKIHSGQRVLIIGASGALGTAGVQLAKYFGAKVTGVCSTKNVELVKSIGADEVIDYKKEDFTKNGQTYDIIYDAVGKSSFSESKNSLSSKGKYVSPVLKLTTLFQMIKTSLFGSKKVIFDATGTRSTSDLRALLQELKKIIEIGKLKTVIDRQYSLAEVPDAHRYAEKGHKRGNLVITV